MVVMSGRGGCGKTFVVSKVLSKAVEVKKRMVMEEYEADLEGADITPDAGNDITSSPDLDQNAQSTNDSDCRRDIQMDTKSSVILTPVTLIQCPW